ncbi:MAG: gliding motility-associated C-terminal domain-containing protein [Saprospiraceae bacterium]|nr:gliding motility-associated C-terminal domain-containing protein [Saprospiraceae bacterium]
MNSRLKILKISYLAALFLLVGTTLKAQMTVSVAVTEPACFNYTNGLATATVTGGTAPYSYSWSNGQAGGQTILGIRAGSYMLTVTDAANVQVTKDFTVGQPTQLVGTATPVGGLCTAGLMNYQGTGSDGTAPYTYVWRNLATNQTTDGGILNAPSAGSYHLSVTDAKGCEVTKVVNIVSDIDVTVRTVAVSCGGDNNGVAEARVSGGLPPYFFSWNVQNATAQTLLNVTGGTYIVTVTDANGCKKSAVGTVEEPPVLHPNVLLSDQCSGSATAKVVPTGGTPPFSITWSNGGIGNRQSNLGVGIYYVTVTDAKGCNKSEEIKVSKQSGVQITTNKFDATCLGINTGYASAKTIGDGLGTYVFKWSNGATSSSPPTFSEIGNLAPGTYTVTATDGAGCKDSATIQVKAQRTVEFSANPTGTVCGSSMGSITITNPVGGTAPYTYNWSTGATTPSVSGLAPGLYMITVTDASGCYGVQTVNVEGISNITATVTKGNAVCNLPTGNISLTNITGGTAPYSYKWSDLTSANQPASRTGLAAGTYKVTITDAAGCFKTNTIDILNVPNFTLTLNVVPAMCTRSDGKISVVASNGTAPYTYKLGTITNTTGIFDGLTNGKYVVSATDANGCTSVSDTLRVNDVGGLKTQFAINQLSCVGDSVTVNFPNNTINGATYAWTFPGGRTSTAFSPTLNLKGFEADVRLIARSTEGCFDTLMLRFPVAALNFTLADTLANCVGTSVNATVANATHPDIRVTYKWTPPASVIGVDTLRSANLRVPAAGSSKVYVLVSNLIGCTKLDSVIVKSVDTAFNPNDIVIKQSCDSKELDFTNIGPLGAYYTWVYGNPSNPIATKDSLGFKFLFSKSGKDSLILVPKLACLDTIKVPFTVRDGIAATVRVGFRDTTICNSNKLTLSATSNINTFAWATDKSFTTILGTGGTLLVTPINRNTTYYVRSRTADGCDAIDSVKIINAEIRIARALQVDACTNIGKVITVTNLTGDPLRVKWTPSSLLTSSDTMLSPTVKITADGTLTGVFTNSFACTLRDTIPLKVRAVKAVATASPTTIYVDEMSTLNASPTGAGNRYSWTPVATVNTPTTASTMVNPKTTTTYILKVTDAFGCEDTTSVTVTVLVPLCAEPYVFIPRAFTPNGDGVNEKVFVRGEYLVEMEFVVYNRWGEQVFLTRDRADGWDGKHKGAAVCPDVYGYYVKGKCKKGEDFFIKGNITVLK